MGFSKHMLIVWHRFLQLLGVRLTNSCSVIGRWILGDDTSVSPAVQVLPTFVWIFNGKETYRSFPTWRYKLKDSKYFSTKNWSVNVRESCLFNRIFSSNRQVYLAGSPLPAGKTSISLCLKVPAAKVNGRQVLRSRDPLQAASLYNSPPKHWIPRYQIVLQTCSCAQRKAVLKKLTRTDVTWFTPLRNFWRWTYDKLFPFKRHEKTLCK